MAELGEIQQALEYIRDDIQGLINETEQWEEAGYQEMCKLVTVLKIGLSILVIPAEIQKSIDEEAAYEANLPDEAPSHY